VSQAWREDAERLIEESRSWREESQKVNQ